MAGSGTRFGTLLDNLKWKELLLRVRPNVENIWFISNGHRRIGDWVQGMKYKEEFPNGAWYLGDGLFFGMDERRPLAPAAGNASAVWIGFLKGGNLKRVKALAGALSLWTEGRKCHLVSPHWGEVNDPKAQEWEKALERQAGVVLEKRSIPGDSDAYFAWLNQWQGFIFIGKGDGRLSYINKTIWDCYMAGVPCLVWEEADPQKVIFGDSVCYWKQSEDLVEVFKRLDEPEERTRLVLEQKEKLEAWLKIDERREFIQWLETWEPKRPDTEMLKWLEQNLFNNKKNTNQLF